MLAFSLGATASAQVTTDRSQVLVKYGSVETLSAPLVLAASGSATGTVATQPVGSQGKTSLRIAFRFPEAPSATGWALRVTHGGQVLWTLKAGEQPAGTERFWSPEFQGNSVNVELLRTDASAKVKVNIEALGEGNALHTKPQAIIGPDQREKIANQPAEIKTAGRSVVRIRFIDAASHDMFVCTGFVVFAPDILLTNEHCLKEPSEVASAEIDFDFDRPDAAPKTVKLKEFVVPPDAGLDFALVRLKQASDRAPLKLRTAPAENTKACW
jgi:V8-like Glu-specific endopeptidase